MKDKITPFLMFHGKALEAMNYYISLFDNSEIKELILYKENEIGEEGTVKNALFSLNEQEFLCLDSPIKHDFTFTPAISIHIECQTEKEIDKLFKNLSKKGKILMDLGSYGFSEKYGWLEDQFGVSWQLNYAKV
jgi:predicted 3-demethylubiquinone-9 3-methyltransferase (glyoxalase superfamily)